MFIEEKAYIKIIDVLPIPCIDLIIMNQGKILLGLRKNNPYKGKWRIPGGRVYKGETQIDGIQRLLKNETNLDLSKIKAKSRLLGVYDVIEQGTVFSKKQVGHAICTTYLIEVGDKCLKDIHPDPQNEELRWFAPDDIEKGIRNVLQGFGII